MLGSKVVATKQDQTNRQFEFHLNFVHLNFFANVNGCYARTKEPKR